MSINQLDSILWDVAVDKEAQFRESALEDRIKHYTDLADTLKKKIKSVEPRLAEMEGKKNRLQDLYIEGGMKKERYDGKLRLIDLEIDSIKSDKKSMEIELKKMESTLKDLKSIQVITAPDSNEIFDMATTDDYEKVNEIFSTDYAHQHFNNMKPIRSIESDAERSEIVHKQVESIDINPIEVESKGKKYKAKEIVVHTFLPYPDGSNEITYLTVGNKIYRSMEGVEPINYPPELYPEFWLFEDIEEGNGETYGEGKFEYFKFTDYRDIDGDWSFADVTDKIYLRRFVDETKSRRRTAKHQELKIRIGDKIGFTEIVKKGNLNYNREYKRVKLESIPFEMIGGKMYFTRADVEVYWNLQI